MMQWKRMGFDLASLEPALHERPAQVHALYASVESTIILAIGIEVDGTSSR